MKFSKVRNFNLGPRLPEVINWYTLNTEADLFESDAIVHKNPVSIVAPRQVMRPEADVQRDVYDSHRHRVFALGFYMTGNELEAEEILTGTFVQAFRTEAVPQAEHVDAALIEELRQRFPLGENEPAASVTRGLVPTGIYPARTFAAPI